ncbi:phage tail protein [Brachyspira murdochii]|uniref:Hvp 28 VSH-1 tail protein n=1 Tax=Brachyspira murdochii TaxID=84378 RepID=A0ABX5B1Y0_9SPIR|nr:phage tail protein [Brachyspira murdochii]PPS21230.1 Hvp 28 VSH-1 tail protein [Brachyspira murdochii]
MNIVIFNNNKVKEIISTDENIEIALKKLKNQGFIDDNDEYKVFDNVQNMGVKDIRAIKNDGSVMSIEEQIENKILILEKDEEIRNGQIYKLDKNIQEDLIKLIELGIEKLEPTQKIEISEDGTKYIIEKSMEEKLRENLITQEEYDNYIIQIRQMQYQTNLDGARAELLDSVLSNLSNQGLLTEEQKTQLDMLNNKRIEIKESNPKSDILLNA